MRKISPVTIVSLLLSTTLLLLPGCKQLDQEIPIEETPEAQEDAFISGNNHHVDNGTSRDVATEENSEAQEDASFSGKIYCADNGEPIEGAKIHVYGATWANGETDKRGSYKITGLPAGELKVVIEAAGYVPRYYDGAQGTYVQDNAVSIMTNLGKNESDIDVALEWGGSISGHVYMPDSSRPVYEARINYLQVSGDKTPRVGGCAPSPPRDSVRSDGSGSYIIRGLLSGDYDLLVIHKVGEIILYSHTITSVTKGEETGAIDFTLEPGGSISGYVYQNDGIKPVAEKRVTAHMAGVSDYSTKTAQDGSYFLKNLPPGEFVIRGEIIIVSSGENTIHDIALPK